MTPINLFATFSVSGSTFNWSPSKIISTGDTVVVNPNIITDYSVTVTDSSGCTSLATISIVVNTTPVANFIDSLGAANDAYFTSTTPNGITNVWNFGDGTTATAQNPSHLFATVWAHYVTLISENADGCSDTITQIVEVGTASLDDVAELTVSNFVLYPNPSIGIFNVQFEASQNQASLKVLNALGEIILTKDLSQTTQGKFNYQLDLTHNPKGIYLIYILIENQVIVRKVSVI